jgi:flagellar basal-body rod protein FlgG
MYTAAMGMIANETAEDVIAANLANVDTNGFKRDSTQFSSFGDTLIGKLGAKTGDGSIGSLSRGVVVSGTVTDFSPGALKATGNPLDVALTQDAALVVQTPNGKMLTRDGAMTRNDSGQLVQENGGALVLGSGDQPIQIPAAAKTITIGDKGQVTVDGVRVGQLQLGGLSATAGAVKVGSGLYSEPSIANPSPEADIKQGFLEASNVSVVKEMVSMISVMRAYETDQKMVQSEDQATDKAVNDVGKV